MTRRRIKIEVTGATLVIRGWRGGDLAREAGCRPIFSGSASGWILDREKLVDVVAYLEYRNVPVSVTESGGAE